MKESIPAVVVGVLLLLVGSALLFWNEVRGEGGKGRPGENGWKGREDGIGRVCEGGREWRGREWRGRKRRARRKGMGWREGKGRGYSKALWTGEENARQRRGGAG